MSTQGNIEGQTTQPTKKQRGVSMPVIIAGGVIAGGVLIGTTAYGLGAFDSGKKSKNSQAQPPTKPPKTDALIEKIDLKKPLDQFTQAELEHLVNTPDAELQKPQQEKKEEALHRAFVMKELKPGMTLDPAICQHIAKSEAIKNKLALTSDQQSILTSLLNECKTRNLLTGSKPGVPSSSENGQTGGQGNLSTGEQTPPGTSPDGTPIVPNPDVTNSNTDGGNTTTPPLNTDGTTTTTMTPTPDSTKPGIIEFLKTGTPTLDALLLPANAELLEAFTVFNAMEDDDRNVNFKNDQAAINAFEALLNKPLNDAYNGGKYLDDAKKSLLEFAMNNAEALKLTAGQKGLLAKVLNKPLKSALQALQEAPSGKAIDFAKITVNKEDVEAVYKHELKALTKKIRADNEMLSLTDFLQLYDYQVKLGFSDSLKLAAEDKPALITKCSTKLDTINNPALKTAITSAGSNADKYQQIYNAYRGVADANTRNNLRTAAMDAVCSRAIIEQAASPSLNFTRNTYQALCLALFAHDLLRGDLKATGIEAGAGAVEKSTDYITTILKVLWKTPMDLLTNWDNAHVQQFTTAINTAFTNMENEIKTSTGADLEEFIGKRYAFVKNLSHFLNTMHLLYTASNDARLNYITPAQKATLAWLKHMVIYQEAIKDLTTPVKSINLIAAVVNNNLQSIFQALSSKSVDFPEITKWITFAKDRTTVGTLLNASWEAMAKFAALRQIEAAKSVNLELLVGSTKDVLYVKEFDVDHVDAVISVLKAHPDLVNPLNGYLDAVLAQYAINGTVKPADDQTAEFKNVIAKRIKFLMT